MVPANRTSTMGVATGKTLIADVALQEDEPAPPRSSG
jgi:hypothetical protein